MQQPECEAGRHPPGGGRRGAGGTPGLHLNLVGSHKKYWCQVCPGPLKSEAGFWWEGVVVGTFKCPA